MSYLLIAVAIIVGSAAHAAHPEVRVAPERHAIVVDSTGAGQAVRRAVRVEKNGAVQPDVEPVVRRVEPLVEHPAPVSHVSESSNAATTLSFMQTSAKAASRNPAGCFKDMWLLGHENPPVYPTEDFENMLAHRKAVLIAERGGAKDYALSNQLAVPFCPEPVPPSSLVEEEVAPLRLYVEKALEGTDPKKPLILALGDIYLKQDYRLLQSMSFICGFQRLGLQDQVVFFTMSNESAVVVRTLYPWLRVLYHDGFEKMLETAGNLTHVYGNRIAKLAVADLLVNMNREVLLTDVDTHWLRDPIQLIETMRTPSGELPDIVAMADTCALELNSGYVFYRPTNGTKKLLRYALGTRKFSTYHPNDPNKKMILAADNDQYLLNCAFARAGTEGLNYVILPKRQFKFGAMNNECRDENREFQVLEAPFVWHTAGFTTSYELEIDRFVALGFVDVNATTGRCIDGRRGSEEDLQHASSAVSRLCKSGADGIFTPSCTCSSQDEPKRARSLLADFGQVVKQLEHDKR